MKRTPENLVFFLGGRDLEMATIRDLLQEVIPGRFYDKALTWGATASAYREEIIATLACGLMPVLVELIDDLGLPSARIVIVDHHGERAGEHRPTSLHQVFALLGLPGKRWTRWFELVAANDRGYIPALMEIGATREEIFNVRAADRAAQGITPEEEAAGERAVAQAKTLVSGLLTIVHLPHARTATVTDRLQPELGGTGYKNLLVCCPEQVNFFGTGQIVLALYEKFPGGWYGGGLPTRGFWGHEAPVPDVLPFLLDNLYPVAGWS